MLKRFVFFLIVSSMMYIACDDDSNPVVVDDNNNPEGRIYITNQADQTVSIYDSKNYSLIKTFATPVVEPHFIQFTHDLQYYFVLGRQVSGSLAKYRTSDDSLIAQVTVQGAVFPTAFAISADSDTLYLTDFTPAAGHTHRYDISGTNFSWIDDVLQAGYQTHDIRISDDGKLVISAGFGSDDITLFNTETGNLKPISLLDGEEVFNGGSNNYGGYGVLIDKTNSKAIISCRKSHFFTYDTTSISPLTIDTVRNEQDQIRIIDLNNSTILDSILLAGISTNNTEPIYMTISPDNNILFVTNNNDASMSVIRLSTSEIIETVPFSTPKPFGISISEDGSRVYVTCTNTRPNAGMLYVIDGETYEKLDSITTGSEPFGLIWTE